jgi:amino acid adenylation domain-containing protein
MLATWKAGAALVPLDPDYPTHRLAMVLEDCQPRMLLTTERLSPTLASSSRRLVLDRDRETIQRESRADPPPRANLDNAAYVIYTSGSTGKPKGTINLHLGVASLLKWDVTQFGITAEDRFLSRCPMGFDVFQHEMLRALVVGARVVLADAEQYRDPAALVQLIRTEEITHGDFVPAMLKALLDEEGSECCTSLRAVIVGGDVLTPEVLHAFYEKTNATLVNIYGPAETAVCCTHWLCDPNYTDGRVPIGRPTAHAVIYILDDQKNPVPIGVEGELYVGGAAVGRGYLNREAMTEEQFVRDPFRPGSQARMYRTGDRGRWLPDGNIEFLGRRDNQVKIRGVRIEIGEVEAVLREFPGVKDAAADVRILPDGEKAIAAYLVEATERPLSLEDLRVFLRQRLMPAMQPASFVMVQHLPVSPNGKVDRRQLPEPNWAPPSAGEDSQERTPTEAHLTAIWSEMLGIPRIGVYDNFFELGGHSLLAIKCMTRIRRELGVDLPLAKIFTEPTIAQLACALNNFQRRSPVIWIQTDLPDSSAPATTTADRCLVPLASGGTRPLFIVHGMGAYVTNLVPLGREMRDLFDVYALEGQGPFDDRAPHDDIPTMAACYVEAIRKQQPDGPYWLAGWSMGGTVAWEMSRQLLAEGERVERLTLLDAHPLWNYGAALRTGAIASRLLPQLGPAFADIESLPRKDRWQAIIERANAYSGAGDAAIRRLIRTCDCHLKASAAYVPERLQVDVVAFWAKKRWTRPLGSLWKKRAGSYLMRTVPGDHYSMLESPNVEQLAAAWRHLIEAQSIEFKKAV